jgi:hypothetical protein
MMGAMMNSIYFISLWAIDECNEGLRNVVLKQNRAKYIIYLLLIKIIQNTL